MFRVTVYVPNSEPVVATFVTRKTATEYASKWLREYGWGSVELEKV